MQLSQTPPIVWPSGLARTFTVQRGKGIASPSATSPPTTGQISLSRSATTPTALRRWKAALRLAQGQAALPAIRWLSATTLTAFQPQSMAGRDQLLLATGQFLGGLELRTQ